ncbi:tRNA pseudouridine(38-40) synthase TruA [Candidatus Dependentiae bacterium]|nr:tRNA pseudouridine(38-40) synthase TruA [Candidatus Dependentiae bacterium]
MKTYKITVAYDGTNYYGWQIQPSAATVAQALQTSFTRTFNHPITLLGASRTDTGVHALGQIARVRTSLAIGPDQILKAWNSALPNDIRIRSLVPIDDNFNPCSNVFEKTYWYTLFLKPPLPFVARYGWYYPFMDRVDLGKFQDILKLYVGTHDFASFCKRDGERTTIRTINSITVKKLSRWNMVHIAIKGPSFLRFQIRRMIGYALDIAQQPKVPVDYIKAMLDNPNPQQTLVKADGSGLCLRKVIYLNELNNEQRTF